MRPLPKGIFAQFLGGLAVVGVLGLRKPDALLTPQFWADDVRPFYLDALYVGNEALQRGYAGYFHLFPRGAAWLAGNFSACWGPAIFTGLAVLATLGVALLCFSPRLKLSGKPWLAVAIAAVPHSGEVFFNVTNVQWLGCLALVLILIKGDPETVGDWVVDIGTVLATGLTGPFVVFLAPLFAVRAGLRRSAAGLVLLLMAAGAAALQIWEYASFQATPNPAPWDLKILIAHVFLHLPLSFAGAASWSAAMSPNLALLAGVPWVALAGYCWWTRDRSRLVRRAALLTVAGVLLGAAAFRVRFDQMDFADFSYGDRYFFVPRVLVLWCLIDVLGEGGYKRAVALTLLVVAIVSTAPKFRLEPSTNLNWHQYCRAIDEGRAITVPILPDWQVEFPERGR